MVRRPEGEDRLLWWVLLLASILLLWGCSQLSPAPSQQSLETLLTGYPGARNLVRSERFDVPVTIVRYAFDTTDAQASILDYYRFRLLQQGFLPNTPRGGAIPSDAYYLRKGCPTYGALIAVDEGAQHVIVELSESRCM